MFSNSNFESFIFLLVFKFYRVRKWRNKIVSENGGTRSGSSMRVIGTSGVGNANSSSYVLKSGLHEIAVVDCSSGEDGGTRKKNQRSSSKKKPRSLNDICLEKIGMIQSGCWKKDHSKSLSSEKKLDALRSILRSGSKRKDRSPSSPNTQQIAGNDRKIPIIHINESNVRQSTRSSRKKVSFAENTPSPKPGKAKKRKRSDVDLKDGAVNHKLDDDAFVNPVVVPQVNLMKEPLGVGELKMKAKFRKMKKVKKDKVEKKDRKVVGIRTRTSPMVFHDALSGLSVEQKDAVARIGLGCFIGMSIDGIPSKLGYYVVDNLDAMNMVLRIKNQTIRITDVLVSRILGLSVGGIDLELADVDPRSVGIIAEWKKQFRKEKMRPSDVMNAMAATDKSSTNFIINFLVLFVNSMGECSSDGGCNYNFLRKIGSVEMIRTINWSQYICDCVGRSKRKWRRDLYDSFYAGPLTFLTLLYVDMTICETVTVSRYFIPIKEWSLELLRQRQNAGFADGGLENAILRVGECEERLGGVDDQYPNGQETYPDYDDAKTVDDYKVLIDNKIAMLIATKMDAYLLIDEAKELFPYEIDSNEYKVNIRKIFTLDDDNDDFGYDDDLALQVFRSRKNFHVGESSNTKDSFVTPLKINFDDVERLDDVAALSPVFISQNTLEIIDDTIDLVTGGASGCKPKVVSYENINEEDDGIPAPSFDLGVSPMKMVEDTERLRKGKQPIVDEEVRLHDTRSENKVGEFMRSPYAKRQVDVGKALTSDEKKIHEWVMSAFGDARGLIYSSNTGVEIQSDAFESLGANEHLFSSVIDGWVDVLNYEERLRSRESPRRHFLKTGLMAGDVLLYDMYSAEDRYTSFLVNLRKCAMYDEDVVNMRNVDMIFVPLMRGLYYYCVVINLKNPAVEIIDNYLSEGCVDDVYDYDVHILHCMLVMHLKRIGHRSSAIISKIEMKILEMGWRTKKSGVDSGVFLMRHMESYMGRGLRYWSCGLAREGPAQDRQLLNLRKKYVTKIVTCTDSC